MNNQIMFEFLGQEEYSGLTKCEFKSQITSNTEKIKKIFLEVEKFVSKNIYLKKDAKCSINQNNGGYNLTIIGKGWDGRCRWCRSFRNHLKTKLSKSGIVMNEKGFCKFDKKEERGISEREKLINMKKRMEMGVIEATQKDYDRLCKKIEELERKN